MPREARRRERLVDCSSKSCQVGEPNIYYKNNSPLARVVKLVDEAQEAQVSRRAGARERPRELAEGQRHKGKMNLLKSTH